jgi:hypothetical protein
MSVRITCINKDNGNHENPHEAIQYLGWINEKTKVSGKTSRLDMFNWIKEKGGEAYVNNGDGNISIVGTATTARGTKYVRTYANGVWNDNLLQLPECGI